MLVLGLQSVVQESIRVCSVRHSSDTSKTEKSNVLYAVAVVLGVCCLLCVVIWSLRAMIVKKCVSYPACLSITYVLYYFVCKPVFCCILYVVLLLCVCSCLICMCGWGERLFYSS